MRVFRAIFRPFLESARIKSERRSSRFPYVAYYFCFRDHPLSAGTVAVARECIMRSDETFRSILHFLAKCKTRENDVDSHPPGYADAAIYKLITQIVRLSTSDLLLSQFRRSV